MRTDDLIARLSADAAPHGRPVGHALLLGLTLGFGLSLAVFALGLGVREDVVGALAQPAFLSKLALVLALAATSASVVVALGQPGRRVPSERLVALAAALVVLVAVDLAATPRAAWAARLWGSNSLACLVFVNVFAAAPLAGLLWALRSAAPTRPALAGAAAGLLAGASGALLYGLYCTDDAPLFVAAWYPLAVAGTSLVGALLGRRFLHW